MRLADLLAPVTPRYWINEDGAVYISRVDCPSKESAYNFWRDSILSDITDADQMLTLDEVTATVVSCCGCDEDCFGSCDSAVDQDVWAFEFS